MLNLISTIQAGNLVSTVVNISGAIQLLRSKKLMFCIALVCFSDLQCILRSGKGGVEDQREARTLIQLLLYFTPNF